MCGGLQEVELSAAECLRFSFSCVVVLVKGGNNLRRGGIIDIPESCDDRATASLHRSSGEAKRRAIITGSGAAGTEAKEIDWGSSVFAGADHLLKEIERDGLVI